MADDYEMPVGVRGLIARSSSKDYVIGMCQPLPSGPCPGYLKLA
jgi:hypothetical protein